MNVTFHLRGLGVRVMGVLNSNLLSCFRFLVVACSVVGCWVMPVLGREPYRKPRIRTITAFVRIEPSQYAQQIQKAVTMLRQAKVAFEKSGYEVQSIRITTQPFTEYIGGRSTAEALDFCKTLDDLSKKDVFLLNIGRLTLTDSSDTANVELLSQILATTRANASVAVAGEDVVHWNAIRAAAQVMKYVEDHSPNGAYNFDFAAVAMVPPNVPFFPASNHEGVGHQFSVGWEAGAFVGDVLAGAHRDMQVAGELLSREFEQQARVVDAVATQVEKDSGWKYMGFDPTPAPNADSSIGEQSSRATVAVVMIPIGRKRFVGLPPQHESPEVA